jgi:hypothetical protein
MCLSEELKNVSLKEWREARYAFIAASRQVDGKKKRRVLRFPADDRQDHWTWITCVCVDVYICDSKKKLKLRPTVSPPVYFVSSTNLGPKKKNYTDRATAVCRRI